MVKRFRGLHPASVIVFIVGVVLGITGVTLAIVFGVKCNTSCPVCPPTAAPPNSLTDCDAKLFTIRTGVNPSTGITWSDDLYNSSSTAFQNASTAVGQNLTDALDGSSSSAREAVFDTQSVKYVVVVTKFERGQKDMVIAYASAAATGQATVISDFDNVTTVAESRLNDTTSTVSPAVNVDSMQFCDSPNTNLSSIGPSPSTSGTCPPPVTYPAVTSVTCENCPPQTECPTTCPPPITCPTVSPSTCKPCPTSFQATCQPCPTCPAHTSSPTDGTCPPPVICPNLTTPAPCDCPTPSSISTTERSTSLLTTLPTLSTIYTLPTSSPCPVCTEQPPLTTCPPCQDCPTSLPPSTCPAVTCPQTTCPECPTNLPPATCPTATCPTVTCPETTCSTGSTLSSIPTSTSSTLTTTTESTTTLATTMTPSTTTTTTTASPTTATTSSLPTTAGVPETFPPCLCTTPFWTSTISTSGPLSTSTATTGITNTQSTLTSISTSTAASTSQSTSSATTTATNTMGTNSLPTSTSFASTQTSTQGATSTGPITTRSTTSSSTTTNGSSVSSTFTSTTSAGTEGSTSTATVSSEMTPSTGIPASTSQGITTSASTEESTTGSGTLASTSTISASTSGMSSTVSSTVESTTGSTTTTVPTTMTTTMEPCPGGKYIYDGDIAVIFEATYLPDTVAQNEQNVMVNTFISTQLLQYGNGGRTASQKGGYEIGQLTRVLPVPYPHPDSYFPSPSSFITGPRSVDGFNASLITVDTLIDTTDTDARIDDGLQYTITATDRGNYSAAVIVAISDNFVVQANASAQQLRAMGYHIFTVALNSTKDFSLLASDADSVFALPNPKISGDAQKVSLAIGDFLVSQSYQCVGATTAPTPSTSASVTPPSTTMPTTTVPACKEEYLTRDVIYMFEDTVTDRMLSNLSATFLNTLIPLTQRDLHGSSKTSPFSNFSILPYPDSDDVCLSVSCNFGQVPLSSVSVYTQTFITAAGVFDVNSSPSGINDGLIFSQNLQTADGRPRNDGRDEIIVLFANSNDGVAAAQATAKNLIDENIGIITVAVGGEYQLGPLSSPGFEVHLLEMTTDQNQLAQEIIADMASLGTSCDMKTTTPATGRTTIRPTSTISPAVASTTVLSTTTSSRVCKEEYLNRDVVYIFENTVTDLMLSNTSATFLNTLIPLAQRDLLGSGKNSNYSIFSILPYPDSEDVCFGMYCNFEQVPLNSVSIYTQAFITAAGIFNVNSTSNGINDGLLFSQNLHTADGTPRNDGRDEIIVLFANSDNGVTAAQATAKSLRDQNIGIITVAVGGQYQLGPLSSPGFAVHLLDSSTDQNQLAQEIIADMASLGTECVV